MKPNNVLLAEDGHIRLADFGLAKGNMRGNKTTSTFCGSPAYLPPELVVNKKFNKLSDIYQIGVVMYEMLIGVPPFYENGLELHELLLKIKEHKIKFEIEDSYEPTFGQPMQKESVSVDAKNLL